MSVKKQIVLIPFWVQEVLQRNQLPLSACLDLEKIKPLMSLNDLVGFLTLQKYMDKILGTKYVHDELTWVWSRGIQNGNTQLNDFLWKTLNTLAGDLTFHKEVESRLLDADAKTDQYKEPFITYDLPQGIVGVVIFPGFFADAGVSEFQKPLVEAILKLLYVYESSHEVAKTPLFKRYLELLAS